MNITHHIVRVSITRPLAPRLPELSLEGNLHMKALHAYPNWSHRKRFAARVALAYMLVGGIWILFSDQWLRGLTTDPLLLSRLHTAKGWAYILATGLGLYFLIRRHLLVTERELTRRLRMERTQQLLRETDRRILQGQATDAVLDLICTELAATFGYTVAWVGLKKRDGSIAVRARAGAAAGYLEEVTLRWDEPLPQCSPAGMAVRTGQLQVCHLGKESTGDPRWVHGLRSLLAIPLSDQDQTLGTLVLGTSRPRTFDADAIEHLTSFAYQVMISLLGARHQEQIRLAVAALEATANAVVITDRSGLVQWVNPAFTQLTGYSAGEVHRQSLRRLESGRQGATFYRELWETITDGRVWKGQMYNRRKDGSLYLDEQTITPVRDANGEITHFVAIKQDATERQQQEEQIRFLAVFDPLTSLPNRRLLEQNLQRVVSQSSPDNPAALFLMDLDNFKLVNDTLGHSAGDQLLVTLAELLGTRLRPGDLLARLSGDSFGLLVEGYTPEQARRLAEKLHQAVNEHRFRVGDATFALGISIGICPVEGTLDPEVVMSQADFALYSAKDLGKNRVVLYQPELDQANGLKETGQWLTRIKDALQAQQFELHFQPVVRLDDEQAEHFESLLRMRAEDGSLVPPGAFIPVAERFGLMPQIDRWVVETVLAVLQEHPDRRIFVNLSGTSLGDDALLEFVEMKVRESGPVARRLTFEITETAAVTNLGRARVWMERLREQGCRFALDDFGVGSSSFAYLRSIPADYVKIDGSFVRNLDSDATNRAIVQALSTVAHTLGKQVIAEWVETAAVAKILGGLGVEYGQGYHWGKPARAPLPAVQEQQR